MCAFLVMNDVEGVSAQEEISAAETTMKSFKVLDNSQQETSWLEDLVAAGEDDEDEDVEMIEELMPPVPGEEMPPATDLVEQPKLKVDAPPNGLAMDTKKQNAKTNQDAVKVVSKKQDSANSQDAVKVVESTLTVPIKTPALKARQTHKVILPNGMKVMIISDPELPSSAAGLANKDGSWQNPNDALGLAHFNEHMVFMGTKKYPKASSFDEFLTANGAQSSNAATGSAVTQYAFSVAHHAFAEGLDRFADMFNEPLFTSKGLHKEIHAVNQEYEMHKDDDGWRQLFVEKATANPKHPYSRFSIGTLKSLGKVDHNEISKFYHTHYSANLMSAVVYTVLPPKKAQKLVAEKFGKIPNRNLKEIHVTMPLLDPAKQKTAVWQKSITTQFSMNLKWELPKELGQTNERNSFIRPDRLLSHILNHQGEKSLFAQLRNSGMIHSIGSSQSDKGFDASMFTIGISLTPAGYKVWPSVVHTVFEALSKLKKTGVPEHIFDTIKTGDLTDYQWQWRTGDVFNAAMDGASNLAHTVDFAAYPFKDDIIQKYDGKAVQELLAVLKPETMHIYALSPEYPAGTEALKVHTEPHYHTQWKVQHLDDALISKWSGAKPASFLEIPRKNPYLPKHLAVTKDMDPHPPVYPAIPQPKVLLQNKNAKVHIWRDQMFGDPYVTGDITLKTDKDLLHKHGVDAVTATDLLMTCMNHAIVSKMQPFTEAGLSWKLDSSSGTNLVMSFSGTNTESAHYTALLKQLAGYLKNASKAQLHKFVDQSTFEMLKTSTLHALQNSMKGSPVSQAFVQMKQAMSPMAYPVKDRIASVKKATFASVNAMAPKLFKKMFFQGFFSGQVKPEEVKAAWHQVLQVLPKSEPLPKSSFLQDTMRVLPEHPVYLHTAGPSHGNAAVLLIDAGDLNCKEREALAVLYQAVPNRFYNDLRTKQQTGYLVQTSTEVMVSHHNIANFVVQSSQYKPGDLIKRFDAFIQEMLTDLKSGDSKTLPEKKFAMIKSAKLQKYKTPNQNIGTMSATMRTLLENYNADWHTLQKKQNIMQGLKYSTVLRVAHKVFSGNNKRRLASLYTNKGSKLDALPKGFVELDMKSGHYVPKQQFKCPVNLSHPTAKRD
jgi:insulysin